MELKILTDSNFETEISNGIWLIHFWSAWCGPSMKNFDLNVQIGKINVEENPELANRFSIIMVPTYIIYKHGKMIKRLAGLQTTETFKKYFQ